MGRAPYNGTAAARLPRTPYAYGSQSRRRRPTARLKWGRAPGELGSALYLKDVADLELVGIVGDKLIESPRATGGERVRRYEDGLART